MSEVNKRPISPLFKDHIRRTNNINSQCVKPILVQPLLTVFRGDRVFKADVVDEYFGASGPDEVGVDVVDGEIVGSGRA